MINIRDNLPVISLGGLTLISMFIGRPSEPSVNQQLLGLATEMSKQRSSVVCISFNCGGVTKPQFESAPEAPLPPNPNLVYYRVPLAPNSQPIDQNGTPLPVYQDESGQPYTLAAK